jgi:glutathione synthase/RimK-type ligase-like ATP-grasp enzyme
MLNGQKRIAFVTHTGLPSLADDDRLAVEELIRRGAEVEPAVWDDPGVQWSGFDSVILRSSWDYHLKLSSFLGWLDRLEGEGVPLWNPAAVVRANVDKGYLVDLAATGIPVIPTVRVEQGSAADLGATLDERGWTDAVVKPAVSGGAFRTWRTPRSQAAAEQSTFEDLLAISPALVQPFLPEIQTRGEWSIIFLGGEYSHAVLKRPRKGDFRVQEHLGGRSEPESPAPELIAQARAAVETIPGPWLYARVDGVETDAGLLLMELELTEPSLFLGTDREAPARFAEAILAR